MRLFGGLGRRFGWLWAAYAISAYGTWLGFGAFSFIAIRVLHADTAEVAAMSAAGLAGRPASSARPSAGPRSGCSARS
jgi:hypothetical protein